MRLVQFAAAVPLLAFLCVPGFAGEADVAAARQTVERQIGAFLADDDAAAYSLAAPVIKRMYPTQEGFMAMVRSGYPPVHRPKNFAFGRFEEPDAGRVVQHVLLLGPDGKDYEAVYTLERQPDGVFRITGVSLRAANMPST